MKKFIFCFMLLIGISGVVFAQETEKKDTPVVEQEKFNTVFSDVKLSRIGGWGSPVFKVANFAAGFNGPFGLIVGGEGGVILDRSFYIGVAGYGLVTDLDKYHITNVLPTGNNVNLSYGGLIFKYHFFPKNVVNFSIGTLVGAGVYGNSIPHKSGTPGSNMANSMNPSFTAEPEIYMFINLAKFCRFGVGGSYRFLIDDGNNRAGLTAVNMWGYSINIMFQFGRF